MEAVRIRLEQIHKTFLHRIKGEVTAVKNVNLEVEPGEFLIVVERTFLGEKADYLLEMDGGRLSATAYDPLRHGTFAVGEEVGVGIEPGVIRILKERGK